MSKSNALRNLKQRRRLEVLERQVELQLNPDAFRFRAERPRRTKRTGVARP